MKTLKSILASALALLVITACEKEEENEYNGTETDESYYASQATVTSSSTNFTANDNGGAINFKTKGGSVTLNINCGCDWIVENNATDLFPTSMTSTSVTIIAGQNKVENDLEGALTFKTENRRITFATITITQNAYGAPEITVETAEWNAPAKGELTTEIAIEASAEWTAESNDEWLTVTKTNSGIALTADENGEITERSTKVTLTCTDGIKTTYDYITVNQDGKAYISLSREYLSLGSNEGSTSSVAVESNYDWYYSYDTSNGWFTVTRNDDVLTVTVTSNEATSGREGTITLTAGDGAENVVEEQLSVVQEGDATMILTYTITSANTTIQLPLYGTVDCDVDWGDGWVEGWGGEVTEKSSRVSHTYTQAGEYDVAINGIVTALNHNRIANVNNPNTTLTAVKQWGNTGLTDMGNAFYYCKKLVSLPEYTGIAFANVSIFVNSFFYCSALEKIPEGMFDNCSAVTNFDSVFHYCSSIKKIPDGLFDSCTEVTSFYDAFSYCPIEKIPTGLFDHCPKVTDFSYVFENCTNLDEIPDGLFSNCPNVTTFHASFYKNNITEIPGGLFTGCKKITDFSSAFYGCPITKIPKGLFDDCTQVTNFLGTFSHCTSLSTIPEGLFDNCTNVTTFQSTFYDCSSLTAIPANLFSNCKKVSAFSYTFYGCSDLTGESSYDQVEINGEVKNVHLYERLDDAYASYYPDVTKITSTQCYRNCTNLTDYDDIPSEWK